MADYQYGLSEEIARWAFEVRLRRCPIWSVIFTNPTAGPWKVMRAIGADGCSHELYRFAQEEQRPDLVLLSDELKLLSIIEAKDTAAKLFAGPQLAKSATVVRGLSARLSKLKGLAHWQDRASYGVVPGLLWAGDRPASTTDRRVAMAGFAERCLQRGPQTGCYVLGIEVLRASPRATLTVSLHIHRQGQISCPSEQAVLRSFAPALGE